MTRSVHTLDDDVRALCRGPLADFVGARQALAKRLKAAGDARESEVRELRKPSASAWAVNLLFGGEPREMAALLGAGDACGPCSGTRRPGATARPCEMPLPRPCRAATACRAWRPAIESPGASP